MKKLVLLLSLVFGFFISNSATITSTTSGGNWSQQSTWVGNTIPLSTDDVVIDGNVTLNGNYTIKTLTINSNKTLTSENGNSRKLSILNSNWGTCFTNNGTFVPNDGTIEVISSYNGISFSGTTNFNNVILNSVTQMNFGASTINGTLRLNSGSYISNHPIYGSNASLEVNGSYSISTNYYLWGNTGNNVPPNIIIISGTVSAQQSINLNKTITILSGASLDLSTSCINLKSGFQSISNSGTLLLGGINVESNVTWNINNNYTISNLTIQNNAIVNANSYTLNIVYNTTGNCGSTGKIIKLVGNGQFNAGTGTISINTSSNGNAGFEGNITLNNIVANGGTITTNNSYTLTINGNVTVNSGSNFDYGNTINNSSIIFGGQSSIINNGGTTSNLTNLPTSPPPTQVETSLTPLPNSSSGGGMFIDGRYLLSPNVYSLSSNMVITGTRKVLYIYQASEFISNGYTISVDSIYLYGKLTISNQGGLTAFIGTAKIVIGNSSTITYNSSIDTQTVTPMTYQNLIFSNSSIKKLQGNYYIKGDFTSYGGNINFNNTHTLEFNGTSNQNISGQPYKNVTFSGSGNKYLMDTCKITGSINILNNANLTTNNKLVLVSNSTSTAYITSIPVTANITGNVISQRYIPSVVRRSRMISPNVSSFTFSDIKDDIFVTGPSGVTNGFDASPTNNATIYTYQESTTGGRGWKSIPTISTSLSSGQGSLIFIRGDRSLPSPQWYTSPYVTQNEVTIDFIGPINKGNISPTITYTNTGVIDDDGWNMIGNPYPSQIDWNLITKNNVSNFYYTLNPSTGSYEVDNGQKSIASGQAIFIKATASSPSITFTESCKTSTLFNGYYKKSQSGINIRMVKDSLNSDIINLIIDNNSFKGYSPTEDAIKLTNSVVNLGFVTDSILTQYNTSPLSNNIDTFIINVNSSNGSYKLSFEDIGVSSSKVIYLRDRFSNTLTNVSTSTEYTFNITNDVLSKGNRFELLIGDPSQLSVKWLNLSYTLQGEVVTINWKTTEEKNVIGYSIEKSTNNKNWESIGFVNKSGNNINDYSYDDNNVNQINYYRIKELNTNNIENYSDVIVVRLDRQTTYVYPNPSSNIITISGQSINGNIIITDMFGKIINKSAYNNKVDISDLPQGVYILNLDSKIQFIKK